MIFTNIAYASTEAHEVVESTTEAVDSGLLSSLGIDVNLLIFQFINFAIVVAILWFLILRPLTKKMNERKKIIDESLENAEEVKQALAKGHKDYEEKINLAKIDSSQIIKQATEEAKRVGEDIKLKTKNEIDEMVQQAKLKIEKEKKQIMSEIKDNIADLSIIIAKKVLSEKFSLSDNKELVDQAIKDLIKYESK